MAFSFHIIFAMLFFDTIHFLQFATRQLMIRKLCVDILPVSVFEHFNSNKQTKVILATTQEEKVAKVTLFVVENIIETKFTGAPVSISHSCLEYRTKS